MDIQEIKNTIPHRYPFLLVDRVTEIEEGKRVVCYKNISVNEPFVEGHFTEYLVMPGVLIVEALAQVGSICVLGMEENEGKIGFLAEIDKCRFKRQVKPGDQLKLEVEITRMRGVIGKGKELQP